MTTTTSTTTSPRFTFAALECIEETGIDPDDDLARLRRREITIEDLLVECLDGADEDRVQGWHEYCATLSDELDWQSGYMFTSIDDFASWLSGAFEMDRDDAQRVAEVLQSRDRPTYCECWQQYCEALDAATVWGVLGK